MVDWFTFSATCHSWHCLWSCMYVVFHSNFAAYIVCRRYKPCEFLGLVWTDCWGNKSDYDITSPANSGHSMIAYHTVIKSCNMWIMLDLWPLKYPCANISPNLFLQKCKQQHLDKLKKVKTPWVLFGASNGGHSMTTNLLPQLTKSSILWFLLDFWPLKILAPTWAQLLFFRNASSSTEIY